MSDPIGTGTPLPSAATTATGMRVAACGLWLAADGTLHLW